MRSMYYDRQGKPIENCLAWGRLFEDKEYKIVKQENMLGKLVFLSTVWLGLDHNFGGGKPLIFETMAFCNKCGYSELAMDRYTTEKEALVGHERLKRGIVWIYLRHFINVHLLRKG